MKTKIDWFRSLPFFLMHIAVVSVFFVPFHWKYVVLCFTLYVFRMFAITAGFHRYFAHRAFKTTRLNQFLLALCGTFSVQKGVLWWASLHREHHREADQPNDIHSPIQDGFIWSHVGWILSDKHQETRWDLIKDFSNYPELVWLNKYYLIPQILFAAILFAMGGVSALIWGFVISTVLLWHGTFTINSLTHIFGKQKYVTRDNSRNSLILALITLGEGWHNNHHCYQSSVRQGHRWWEIDVSFYVLKIMSWFGSVWDLRKVPLEKLKSKRINVKVRNPRPEIGIGA
jgi:stearoyl-CoA desaturase (Delta-9 desaturase)